MAGTGEPLDDSSAVSSCWLLPAANPGEAAAHGLSLQGLLAKRLSPSQVTGTSLMHSLPLPQNFVSCRCCAMEKKHQLASCHDMAIYKLN